MGSPRRKPKKDRLSPADRIATRLELPGIQIGRGDFAVVDIANRTDADQRHMTRSGEKRTVRRTTAIDRLLSRKAINRRQAAVCEWYATQHEAGFEVGCGTTANYEGAGGGGAGSIDLFARHRAQMEARLNYLAARSALTPGQAHVFERVVIASGSVGDGERGRGALRLMSTFKLCIQRIEDAVGDRIAEQAR